MYLDKQAIKSLIRFTLFIFNYINELTQCFGVNGHVVFTGIALEHWTSYTLYLTERVAHEGSKRCVVIGTVPTVPSNVT